MASARGSTRPRAGAPSTVNRVEATVPRGGSCLESTASVDEPRPPQARARGWQALTARGRALVLLAVLLLLLAGPKLALSLATHAPGIDGGYYADIAANVRDGHGLRTDVSLLHKGYPSFPYPTDVYPLWPLLYGLVATVAPLVGAGVWLATLLYFVALILAYLWASRVWPEPFFARVPLDAGHVAVVVFGLAGSFFQMTSLPYTEGLAFSLLFATLWRAHVLLPQRTIAGGLELGAWAGLLVLARTQLLLVLLALGAAVLAAMVLAPGRSRTARFGAAIVAAFAGVMTPEYLRLRTFIPHATPLHLLTFDRNQATEVLSRYQVIRASHGVLDFLADRAGGFVVAFTPTRSGYWSQFDVFTYAPLLALVPVTLALVHLARGGPWGARLRRWLQEPGAIAVGFLVIFVAGAFASIHTMHKSPDAWYFHRRHALTTGFLLVAAMVALLRGGRVLRVAGVALLVAGAVLGGRRAITSVTTASARAYAPSPQVLRWIEEEKRRGGPVVLALRRPQTIAWATDGVGYHWFDATTTVRDLVAMADHLRVSAVLVPSGMSVDRSAEFRRRFERSGALAGARLYRPRGAGAGGGAPPPPDVEEEPSSERAEDE